MDEVARALGAASGMNLIIVTKLYEKGLFNEADLFEIASKMKSMTGSAGAHEAAQMWLDVIERLASAPRNGG